MTLSQLEYILAIEKYRHFEKAAQSCFVTQPTLSMQVQKFEKELGVTIFDRSKNPIMPTLEGELILKQAKRVIQENKKIKDIILESQKMLCGNLKLAVIPTLAAYLIPLFANEFSQHYPGVELVIQESKTEDIIELLDSNEIDAGLLVTPLYIDNVIEKPLYYEPFQLFIDPKHHLSAKNSIKQDDLCINDIWLLNKGNCFRDQVLNICSESKNKDDSNLKFESGNFETLKNMVLQCSGYTILPQMAVDQLHSEQKKFVRPFEGAPPTREVSIVYNKNYNKQRILSALEEMIIKSVPQEFKELKNQDKQIIEITAKS